MMRALFILGYSVLATGCATHTQTPPDAVYGATLSDPPGNAARDLIRTYVRDLIGPDYIVDIDRLSRSNKLVAVDRGRGQITGRPIPVPDKTFRLELVETLEGLICRLVPDDKSADRPVLVLPPDMGCELLPATI